MATLIKQYSTATSGTVTLADTQQNVQLIHNAASLAATLTVAAPATPIDGQTWSIGSVLGVTALTLSSSITIVGALTAIVAGGFATYMYSVDANKWIRTA